MEQKLNFNHNALMIEQLLQSRSNCSIVRAIGQFVHTAQYVQNGGSGDQKFSFKRSAQVITMAKDKVKQQAYLKGTMNYRKVGSQRRYQLLECCGHFLH